jgi:sialate O-acetylesterase
MARRTLLAVVLVLGTACLSGRPAQASVKPHGLIGDGMVLQQGMKVPIWGTADDGEEVTVRFQEQEKKSTTKDGKWLVRLDNLKPGGPYEMTIAGKNTLTLKNVLVGEVWVCSGQSNMWWTVALSADAQKNIEDSTNPMIHLFTVPDRPAPTPQHDVVGKWQECGPETVKNFSAVAYFFGRDIQKARNVPVGLIHSSWGGTVAEAWTSRGALEGNPELKPLAEQFDRARQTYPKALAAYNANREAELAKYKAAVEKAKAEGKKPPPPPQPPQNPDINPNSPTALYNGKIAPLQPYAIRGAIWYQGESNLGRAAQYQTLFPALIKDWRDTWGQGEFPFLFVQLAPFTKIVKEPGESAWAELCEAQLLTSLRVPNTAMAVITDVGDENDIHPKKKEPVGARLALAALALAYGEKIVYSGPVYDTLKVEGDKAILGFKSVGGGMVAKDGPLTGFAIAGADKKFVNAEAEIEGDKVVVKSPKVTKPVAVRFGWASCPVVNLCNKEGLPASPFRTDRPEQIPAPRKP